MNSSLWGGCQHSLKGRDKCRKRISTPEAQSFVHFGLRNSRAAPSPAAWRAEQHSRAVLSVLPRGTFSHPIIWRAWMGFDCPNQLNSLIISAEREIRSFCMAGSRVGIDDSSLGYCLGVIYWLRKVPGLELSKFLFIIAAFQAKSYRASSGKFLGAAGRILV